MNIIQILKDTIKGNTYEIDCEVITPLAMGNANKKAEYKEAELREQSINGVLRWFFRVAGGSKENEQKLFGTVLDESKKGLVKLKVISENIMELSSKQFINILNRKQGFSYLGFSFRMNKQNFINSGYKFKIIISFNPLASKEYKEMFFATLWLAFNLGNFGSRSRRGFGAIQINSITHNNQKINQLFSLDFIKNFDNNQQNNNQKISQYYKNNLEKIKHIFNNNKKINGIPIIFDNFHIYLFSKTNYNDYVSILDEIGSIYKNYRIGLKRKGEGRKRYIFGLPLRNFDMRNRRASLLIFKPIKFNNSYSLLIIKILPTDKRSFIFHNNIKVDNSDYNYIRDFLKNDLIKIYEP